MCGAPVIREAQWLHGEVAMSGWCSAGGGARRGPGAGQGQPGAGPGGRRREGGAPDLGPQPRGAERLLPALCGHRGAPPELPARRAAGALRGSPARALNGLLLQGLPGTSPVYSLSMRGVVLVGSAASFYQSSGECIQACCECTMVQPASMHLRKSAVCKHGRMVACRWERYAGWLACILTWLRTRRWTATRSTHAA